MINENGLTIAYLGDAIYELRIREYLISKGIGKVDNLHKTAIKYTSAEAQSKIMDSLIDTLSEEETEYYKRGRNSGGTHRPKNSTLRTYRNATGLESLIGALYLENKTNRLNEIIEYSINFINTENGLI